jgi:hypothetical protein
MPRRHTCRGCKNGPIDNQKRQLCRGCVGWVYYHGKKQAEDATHMRRITARYKQLVARTENLGSEAYARGRRRRVPYARAS